MDRAEGPRGAGSFWLPFLCASPPSSFSFAYATSLNYRSIRNHGGRSYLPNESRSLASIVGESGWRIDSVYLLTTIGRLMLHGGPAALRLFASGEIDKKVLEREIAPLKRMIALADEALETLAAEEATGWLRTVRPKL